MNLKTVVIAVLCISCAAAGGHERKKWMEWKEPDKECDEQQSEPEFPQVGSVPGTPGVDFPSFTEIPSTTFTCADQNHVPGFYPDLETGCQQNSMRCKDDIKQPELNYSVQKKVPEISITARSIHGIPGVDFPIFTDIPNTKFSCAEHDNVSGFYADLETGCQVYHVCLEDRRVSHLCPVGTVFNQHLNVCDYWYNVECSKSPKHKKKNHNFETLEQSDPIHKELADSILERISEQLDRSESESQFDIPTPKNLQQRAKNFDLAEKWIQCTSTGCDEPETSDGTSNFTLVSHPVEGIPGLNFPIFKDIPKTKFTCADYGYAPGFYADTETDCQVFHVCSENRRESFLCPIGTIFSQALKACDYWYNVKCSAPLKHEERLITEDKKTGISDSTKSGSRIAKYPTNPGSDVCFENEWKCFPRFFINSLGKPLETDDWYTECSALPIYDKENCCPEELESFNSVTAELLAAMLEKAVLNEFIQSEKDSQLESEDHSIRKQNQGSKYNNKHEWPTTDSSLGEEQQQYKKQSSEKSYSDRDIASFLKHFKKYMGEASVPVSKYIRKKFRTLLVDEAVKVASSILRSMVPLLPVKSEAVDECDKPKKPADPVIKPDSPKQVKRNREPKTGKTSSDIPKPKVRPAKISKIPKLSLMLELDPPVPRRVSFQIKQYSLPDKKEYVGKYQKLQKLRNLRIPRM